MTAESVRTGACVTSGAEKLAARGRGEEGGRMGVKRRRYGLGVTRMPGSCMRDCRVDRFRAKTRGSAVRTRHDPIGLLEISQDLLALRLFQRCGSVAGRDCRNQADEDGKAGEPTHFGGLRQPQPVPSGLAGTTSANCRVVPGIVSDRKLNPARAVPVPSARRTLADRLGFSFSQLPEIWHASKPLGFLRQHRNVPTLRIRDFRC